MCHVTKRTHLKCCASSSGGFLLPGDLLLLCNTPTCQTRDTYTSTDMSTHMATHRHRQTHTYIHIHKERVTTHITHRHAQTHADIHGYTPTLRHRHSVTQHTHARTHTQNTHTEHTAHIPIIIHLQFHIQAHAHAQHPTCTN